MKAVRFHEHGGTDRLIVEEVPMPVAGPAEVVVRVKACALNHLDIWERKGISGVSFPLPHISGSDVSGLIESTGHGVTHLNPGDRTVINPGLSCMLCPECFSGRDNYCRKYSVLGYFTDGGYAQFVKVPAVNALPYPKDLAFAEAAAIPLVFMTAWHMLITRCRLQPGEDVLILGAGSGVGSAAIQIAKYFHARVLTTAGSEEKLERALDLGADYVIDHSRQSISSEVKRITGKRGVDIVFEHVGSATWEDSIASLAHHGRLVTCGATTGYAVQLNLRQLFAKELSLHGSYMGSKAELLRALQLVEAGHLRPVVARTFPLEEAAAAQSLMENREQFGKIVLLND